MLILAFDTATEVATSALVEDGEVLGERCSRAVDGARGRRRAAAPGRRAARATSTRSRSASAPAASRGCGSGSRRRGGSRSRSSVPAAGRLDPRRARGGRPGRTARRSTRSGARCSCSSTASRACLAPADVPVTDGTTCVGDGARPLPRAARGRRRGRPARRERAAPPARPLPRGARARLRAGRAGRAALPPRSRRRAGCAMTVELRRLSARDLTRSRRSSSARTRRRGRARCSRASSRSRPRSASARSTPTTGALVGYLIISRYVDAWHVMNVAVAPEHRRRGIATALLERLFELTADDGRRGYTLEVRVSNAGRDPPLRAARLRRARRSGAATTPTTARTR